MSIIDFTDKDVNFIVSAFHREHMGQHDAAGETTDKYYCGITDDPEERAVWHRVDKFLYCVECDSFETSSEVERKLDDKGFDCGKGAGHGREDSVYVYMYKKISGVTRETE